MPLHDTRGFTLIELIMVVVVLGTMVAFSVPAFSRFLSVQNLRGAADTITSEMRIARQKAISTGTAQTMHFHLNTVNCDYHIHNAGVMGAKWNLPTGITYYSGSGVVDTLRMKSDGTIANAGMIILQNPLGVRDTVGTQLSGLILHR